MFRLWPKVDSVRRLKSQRPETQEEWMSFGILVHRKTAVKTLSKLTIFRFPLQLILWRNLNFECLFWKWEAASERGTHFFSRLFILAFVWILLRAIVHVHSEKPIIESPTFWTKHYEAFSLGKKISRVNARDSKKRRRMFFQLSPKRARSWSSLTAWECCLEWVFLTNFYAMSYYKWTKIKRPK